ncbi:MAG: ATPase [Synechococcales cyanobacterium T60_A2020_003]|nr:ATPase [Synechococcales cyanobacterium T60_A2020_003]
MTVSRTISLGFLAVITVGAFLLMLPLSTADGSWSSIITALFTSTSAVCVTGLIVEDTGSYYSPFGQAVILLLIQIGGLGYMTVTTFLLILLGRRFGLREKLAIQQSLDIPGMSGATRLVRSIIAMTLIFELTGVFCLLPVFLADYGPGYSLWLAIFHSISAFNNAGFSLFADSLMGYAVSVPINLVIPGLIIFGGIGYQVIMEGFFWFRNRLRGVQECTVFSLNFKIVTSTTIFLLIFGVVAFLATPISHPDFNGSATAWEHLIFAWSQSVMPRTAGFNTVDYGQMTDTALFMTIALMIVGASPGSTGGGIKTTTLRILMACTKAVLQGKEEVLCYQRQIPMTLIIKAVGVVFGSGITIVLATTLISWFDPEIEFIRLLFEVVSAFATVGLSTGITAALTPIGKIIIIGVMYVGRVGVLILMASILGDPKPTTVNYPEENLLVG